MTVANFEKFKSSECLHQRPGTEKRCSHNLGRSTHNVASEVLNKTKKNIDCVSPSFGFFAFRQVQSFKWPFLSLSNRTMYSSSDITEDLAAPSFITISG